MCVDTRCTLFYIFYLNFYGQLHTFEQLLHSVCVTLDGATENNATIIF